MPTAIRDMQPWRAALKLNGLTYAWLGERTDRSPDTVEAYALGRRTPPADWLEKAAEAIAEHERTAAA